MSTITAIREHEHLYCQQCGKIIEFQNPAVELLLDEVCRQHKFQNHGHTFIVRGVCAECNRGRVKKRRCKASRGIHQQDCGE